MGYLPLPTCVGVRYGPLIHTLDVAALGRGFSRQPGHHVTTRGSSPPRARPWSLVRETDFPVSPPLTSNTPCPFGALTLPTASPHSPVCTGAGLSTCSPSPTLDEPRVRSRLTLGRLPWPRNPQASGVVGSHHHSRYSFRHSRFAPLQVSSRSPFSAGRERSPTTGVLRHQSAASVDCLSPAVLSAQEHSTSELLRTLSRMAASKPTSWLSRHSHHLSHSAVTGGP